MQNILPPDTAALAVEHVTKTYLQWQRTGKVKDVLKNLFRPAKKEVQALDDLSLTVQPGEFVAYAGANGAGKSTTIKILSGILQPTVGSVRVLGKNPAKHRVALMRRAGVLFGQRSELWWDFPVIASYEWKKAVWGIDDATYERMLATVTHMLDLDGILHTFARELSLGQKMRADLGMLLLHDPEIIFLDEPTLGLDVLAKKQLISFLKHINAENGTTILVTSHDMDDLQEMAKRIVLLSQGRVVFDGTFEQLRRSRKDSAKIHVITTQKTLPNIPKLKLVSRNGDEAVYDYDPQKADMSEVLKELLRLENIEDVEIKKAPIEDVIANLYRELKTGT